MRLASVHEDAHVGSVYMVMKSHRVHHVAVLRGQTFVGLISQESLLDSIMTCPHDFDTLDAKHIMIRNLPIAYPETLLEEIVQLMKDNNLTALPYIENNECKALITRPGLIKLTRDCLEDDPNILEQAISKSEAVMANPLLQRVMSLLSDIGI